MIPAWWLIIIVPAAASIGYAICGMFAFAAEYDKCEECKRKSK